MTVAATAEAYRHCESVTRAAAGNFYYGIRLLPVDKRLAMCAVYAFARRVDDIGDGTLDAAAKLRGLDAAVRELDGLATADGDRERAAARGGAGLQTSTDPVIVALADAHARFTLPLDALDDLVEGVRMDVRETAYRSFDELLLYCRRVAGSIGRLCLQIFGSRDPRRAAQLADDLGVALQLTNILRDLREDAENRRLYLPLEDLTRFAVGAPLPSGDDAQRDALIRFQALRAREWFDRGMPLVALLDRRSAACVLAMAGIYSALLDRIEADPARAMRERIALPTHEKALIAVRSLLGAVR